MFCLAANITQVRQNITRKIWNYKRLKLLECTTSSMVPLSEMGSGGSAGSKHQITYKPYVKPCYKDHDHKNMGLKRPMSPHLTIYAPTLPAMTSITQRITGTIVTFYAIMLSGGALFLSNGIDSYVSAIQSLDMSRPLILIVKLVLGLPFSFHYFNGIRYVVFNTGKWLSMKEIYATAQKCFVCTAVCVLLFAFL